MQSYSELTLTAVQAALKAGEILRSGFGQSFKIGKKPGGNHNLVTDYDYYAEEAVISFIEERFPKHSFLSEEKGAIDKKNGSIQWVIDPLDGTVNFAHNLPFFAVSIAAVQHDKTLCGVIYAPMIHELFIAERGNGAYLNGNKLKVTSTTLLKDATLATGFPYNMKDDGELCIERFTSVIKLGVPVRRLGSAALDLAYVAAGRFDAYWETALGPWDIAAGRLLVEEAGGEVTHFNGAEFVFSKKNSVLATNKKLHKQLMATLKKHDH
ncbi:MAG: inositol monophosphatase [Chlamydiae bacterium]|nr:inositol monophosphatase [Chlamydiota bacterium]